MENNMNVELQVSNQYLNLRNKLLNYSNNDMGLTLDNDEQVYIGLFDVPIKSGIVGFQTQSLGLLFGLNTHIYYGSGQYVVGLEKYPEIKKAMQSSLISSHQVLSEMKLVDNYDFFHSENIRVYLKTRKGVYFKELNGEDKSDKFLTFLMNNVFNEIHKVKELNINF